MPRLSITRTYAVVIALVGGAACVPAASPQAPAADFDRPVPAGAARETMALRLDLLPASDCEERFDLAIYEHRAVELVAWDHNRGACVARDVSIRYVAAKIDGAALMKLVRTHAKSVKKKKTRP